MKIFITGATGFIGSYILLRALNSGHTVLAHRRTSLSSTCIPLPHMPSWLQCPLEEIPLDCLQDVDVIIHLAAVGISPRVATLSELYDVNIKKHC